MSTAHWKSGQRNLSTQSALIPALAAALVLGIAVPGFGTEPAAAVTAPSGLPWLQTFSNDFTSANAQTYANSWFRESGDGSQYGIPGWGNNEKELYNGNAPSASNPNLYVNSNGLNITAVVNGSNITSARINTKNNFSQTYGLFQWTASTPSGDGVWPALWMLPEPNSYGGWPKSGEIDVFESGGSGLRANQQEQGSYHSGPSYDISATAIYGPNGYDTRTTHTYDLLWLPAGATFNRAVYPHGVLAWYVDGSLYETQTGSNAGTNNTGWYNPGGSGSTNAGPFDKPFYLVMNLAIGGNYTNNTTPPNGSYTMTISDVEAFSLPVLGDLNRDGHLDAKDITAMQSALTDEAAFASSNNLSVSDVSLLGDMNGDGQFNNADLQKLENVLKSGGGSNSTVPEPSSLVLLALGALMLWKAKDD